MPSFAARPCAARSFRAPSSWVPSFRAPRSISRSSQGASLDHAQLQGAMLDHASSRGRRSTTRQLQGASLEEAQLQGAMLAGAHLEGATLDDAQLRGAVLSQAHLEGASLQNAQLKGAILLERFVWRAEIRLEFAKDACVVNDAARQVVGRSVPGDQALDRRVDSRGQPAEQAAARIARLDPALALDREDEMAGPGAASSGRARRSRSAAAALPRNGSRPAALSTGRPMWPRASSIGSTGTRRRWRTIGR